MQEDERQLSGAMLREEAIIVAPPPGPLHVASNCVLGICTFAWLAVPGDTEASGASAWTLIEGFVVPMSPNDELGWITLYTEDRDWLISAVFNTNQTHGSPQDDDGSLQSDGTACCLPIPQRKLRRDDEATNGVVCSIVCLAKDQLQRQSGQGRGNIPYCRVVLKGLCKREGSSQRPMSQHNSSSDRSSMLQVLESHSCLFAISSSLQICSTR